MAPYTSQIPEYSLIPRIKLDTKGKAQFYSVFGFTMAIANCLLKTAKSQTVAELLRLKSSLSKREYGIGVRSAMGMFLHMNMAVEIEAVFELY